MTLREDALWLKSYSSGGFVEPHSFEDYMSMVSRVSRALLIYLPLPKSPNHDAEMADWDSFFKDPKFRGMLGTTEPITNPNYQGD